MFDYVLIAHWTQKRTRLVKQTIFHHVVLVLGFSTALVTGYFGPGTAACCLFCESSSIFYCVNELIRGKGYVTIEFVSQICFFVCYTVFRIGLFPYINYLCLYNAFIFIPHLSLLRAACLVFSALCFFSVTILNFYWYSLILRKLRKMLKSGQAKPASTDLDEEAED